MREIEIIYTKYVDDLFSYGLHLGFEAGLVKDAIHNVFHKLLINNKVNFSADAKPYLLKSVRNELLDEYKRQKNYLNYDKLNELLPFNLEVNAEDVLLEKEFATHLEQKINTVLKSLTPRQREIIYLRYTQDYSYKQISEILNISVPACRNLILKALKQLRKNNAGYFYLFLSNFSK